MFAQCEPFQNQSSPKQHIPPEPSVEPKEFWHEYTLPVYLPPQLTKNSKNNTYCPSLQSIRKQCIPPEPSVEPKQEYQPPTLYECGTGLTTILKALETTDDCVSNLSRYLFNYLIIELSSHLII